MVSGVGLGDMVRFRVRVSGLMLVLEFMVGVRGRVRI